MQLCTLVYSISMPVCCAGGGQVPDQALGRPVAGRGRPCEQPPAAGWWQVSATESGLPAARCVPSVTVVRMWSNCTWTTCFCPMLWPCSHLPDITVMTPVGRRLLHEPCLFLISAPCTAPGCLLCVQVWSGGKVVFWVASRGHHADIGACHYDSPASVIVSCAALPTTP